MGILCVLLTLSLSLFFHDLGALVSDGDPDQVTISREELAALRAAQPATVTISTAEYQRLRAGQGHGVDPEKHQRVVARLAEVEQLLRREMAEHAAEIAAMSKRLEHK